ncbi:MAG: substrate-binding periplasmic protein [Massilia sp.]
MKLGLLRPAIVGATTFCLLLTAAQPATACTAPVRMGTGQLEPYGYYDAQHRYTGLDADMVRAIMREAGCTLVELPLMPDGRNLLMFEKGQVDLMAGASITPERLKLARFSVPYREERVGLFALADGFDQYTAVDSFSEFLGLQLRMLAPRAGWYGEEFARQVPWLRDHGRLSQFSDIAQGVRMLKAGRAPFMLGDAAGIEHAAARQGVKVRPLPFWVVDAPVHLMLSRATLSEADVREIDAAIARLERRGALAAIRQAYGAS